MSDHQMEKLPKAAQRKTLPTQESTTPAPHADLLQLQRTLGNRAVQRLLIQPKLTVGAADDVYEQEADAVAKQVMTMPVKRDVMPEDELPLKRVDVAQRAATPEDDELDLKRVDVVQRAATEEESEASADVEAQIDSMRGGGQPLPDSAREFFEPRFEQDFSSVRVHTGQAADSLNRSLSARAFATGSDIFVRDGDYNPDSSSGRELLAHELTHVVQQGGSQPVQAKPQDDCDGC